jgi:hypothetical protein
MTCLLKEPGATLPIHRHPEIAQTCFTSIPEIAIVGSGGLLPAKLCSIVFHIAGSDGTDLEASSPDQVVGERLWTTLLKSKILELLDQHRIRTLATNRPDGWPQATTVGYVRGYRCASVPSLLANRNPGQSGRGFCPYSMVAI